MRPDPKLRWAWFWAVLFACLAGMTFACALQTDQTRALPVLGALVIALSLCCPAHLARGGSDQGVHLTTAAPVDRCKAPEEARQAYPGFIAHEQAKVDAARKSMKAVADLNEAIAFDYIRPACVLPLVDPRFSSASPPPHPALLDLAVEALLAMSDKDRLARLTFLASQDETAGSRLSQAWMQRRSMQAKEDALKRDLQEELEKPPSGLFTRKYPPVGSWRAAYESAAELQGKLLDSRKQGPDELPFANLILDGMKLFACGVRFDRHRNQGRMSARFLIGPEQVVKDFVRVLGDVDDAVGRCLEVEDFGNGGRVSWGLDNPILVKMELMQLVGGGMAACSGLEIAFVGPAKALHDETGLASPAVGFDVRPTDAGLSDGLSPERASKAGGEV